MKKLCLALTIAALTAGSAMADEYKNCTTEPESKWKTKGQIADVAKSAGYEVRKVKIEGSCYEVYGIGSDGVLMELFYNPVTAKILFTKKKS